MTENKVTFEIEEWTYHIVEPTDTIQGISLKFNMPVSEIKRKNQLLSLKIAPNQVLKVKNPHYKNSRHPDIGNLTKNMSNNTSYNEFNSTTNIEKNNEENLYYKMKNDDISSEKDNNFKITPENDFGNQESDISEHDQEAHRQKVKLDFNKEDAKIDTVNREETTVASNEVEKLDMSKQEEIMVTHSDEEKNEMNQEEKHDVHLNINQEEKHDIFDHQLGASSIKKDIKIIDEWEPKILSKSDIFVGEEVLKLHEHLPVFVQSCNWVLLYSLQKHGADISTLFYRVSKEARTLLVVKTVNNEVFGGFTSSIWKPSTEYYGTGDSFLFKFAKNDGTEELRVFRITRVNNYFMICSDKSIGMGGGGGHFGLYIGEDLCQGSTGPCETYNNECLCSRNEFEVFHLEVWAFTTASSEQRYLIANERDKKRGMHK